MKWWAFEYPTGSAFLNASPSATTVSHFPFQKGGADGNQEIVFFFLGLKVEGVYVSVCVSV